MGLSDAQREEVMNRAGWQIWQYDGKLEQAPRQIRHLVRELSKGEYVVNFKLNRIAGTSLPPKGRTVAAFTQAFKDTFNTVGWKFFQKTMHDGGIPVYAHYDALPHSVEAKDAEKFTMDRPLGYYAARGRTIVGPFTYPVDVVDDLVAKELTPLLDGIVVEAAGEGNWIFTEFGNGRGGIVTDGPMEQGLVMAFLPQNQHSVVFGRLAAISPDMFQLIYQISTTARATEGHIEDWQNRARLIVGHVNA